MGAALHALATNECAQWPRRRKTGRFVFAGEDAGGAALLADEEHHVYRVLGLSTSLGDLMRASGKSDLVGSALQLTLLPFLGMIVYDGTLRGAKPNTDAAFLAELATLASTAQADGSLITELPRVTDAPLLGKRVLVSGLQSKPELNGKHGLAGAFVESKGRYAVALEDGSGQFSLKADNLEAVPRKDAPSGGPSASAAGALSERERALQERLMRLEPMDDFWVMRRMGYSEAENPQHMGVIISSKSGMMLGTFQSRHLAPTAGEYLRGLEDALFGSGSVARPAGGGGRKPRQLAVDEKSAVDRLEKVLGPAGIGAGYYPPPAEEELAAMGIS